MSLSIVNILKKIGGGVFALDVTNALYRMRTPKIGFSIVQPAKEGGYVKSDAFLDVKEVNTLIRNLRVVNSVDPKTILKSYKGGKDEKFGNRIVSRVLSFERDMEKKQVFVKLELVEGEQSFVENKYGQKVPGIVKPKRGGESLQKGSIALTRDEALYLADMLDRELMAWRVILGSEFYHHPERFRRPQKASSPVGTPPQQQDPRQQTAAPPQSAPLMDEFPDFPDFPPTDDIPNF